MAPRPLLRRAAVTLALAGCALLAAAVPATADDDDDELTRIRFDELSARPVDGLRFRGVMFRFRVDGMPSSDATFGAFGPGETRFVQDPSIEGDARGVLSLRLAEETEVLRFGAAVSCFECVLRPGFVVRLFDDDGELVRVARVTTRSPVSFSEARFAYRGEEIARAVIRFNAGFQPGARFAFDNLVFERDDDRDSDRRAAAVTRAAPGWAR